MIGLSVAVGRFVEALLWAILRAGGVVAIAVTGGAVALVMAGLLVRQMWRRR